jgi:flavin reductase (DIM6/NTAB) family NADH-FMN oxidoreductase RutF
LYFSGSGFLALIDDNAKRTLLRHLPHPLNICGVKEGEEINGFTLSWTTQASFKPPMIAIGVRQDSRSHAMIKASQVFAVSFLEKSQKDMAETFFKPQKGEGDKFGDIGYYLGAATGCPIIESSLGYIECQVKGSLEEGDHSIFLGEVIAAALHREGEPLLLQDTPWQYGG